MLPWFRTSRVPPWQVLGSNAAEPGVPDEEWPADDEHAAAPAATSARAAERTDILRMGRTSRTRQTWESGAHRPRRALTRTATRKTLKRRSANERGEKAG